MTQRVVAGFVVPQVQEGWLRQIGRRYGRDLIVFVALALAVIGLKTTEGQGKRSVPQYHRKYSIASVTAAVEKMATPWQRDSPSARQRA